MLFTQINLKIQDEDKQASDEVVSRMMKTYISSLSFRNS